MKVMIVDDSRFMRNRLTKLLNEHNYETTTACDGVEAIRLYQESRPEAVLMDITMPRKDGLEALAEIRKLDMTCKVIMLTALDQPRLASQAILAGAKDFLTKPVQLGQLLHSLGKALD